ncbi:tyrosine-protein kinase BTK-like isoform X2 [Apostichopus japonicus]|uniref:tyrosine-protein kinase BTK-like isoform X2 n=1 Tax=Stichopus japonicus TaxID=307972 RepID=UPI003AB1ED69
MLGNFYQLTTPVKWHRRERNKSITTKHQKNIQNNDVLETDEPNYYSTADVTEGRSQIIVYEKDISIINSIKMGNIYNRWLGTVNLPSRSNTCVVITSITETVWRTNEIHWEAFLRNCLQLPESKNLTKIEAISIESNNLYLVSEHLVCGTLHCLLTQEAVEKRNVYCCSSLPDVIKHVTGLLEGMHIINTYGFLHPGLSTRKLLVTTDGQLKLYNFCLAGHASRIATLQRSKMFSATLNQYPPEMLISSEYTESSDVWSIAITIWEIMSNGMSPFPDDTEITSHKELFEPSFPWPEKYFQIKDKILYNCWSQNCACRPSIHRLKGTFMEIFQKLLDDSSYEIPLSTTYVAMGSANIAEDTYS